MFLSKVEYVFHSSSERQLGQIAQVSRGKIFCGSELSAKETLARCILKGHDSVLEFADLCVFITCPIFVARQLMRYRAASYLERSMRYGSPTDDDLIQSDALCADLFREHSNKCNKVYDDLFFVYDEPREIARAVLPLSTPTQFVMKANLREWLHIFDQRITPYAQSDTRDLVEQVYEIVKEKFPLVIEKYEEKHAN